MKCTDYRRHERLLDCRHYQAAVMVAYKMADGCSGRLCAYCEDDLGAKHWSDVAERIPGPVCGLDALEVAQSSRPVR